MKHIDQLKARWRTENEPLGKRLGYPQCCIDAFCKQPPELMAVTPVTKTDKRRFKAAHINGTFTGFIPCGELAEKILRGEINLADLIKDRDTGYPPFPNAFK